MASVEPIPSERFLRLLGESVEAWECRPSVEFVHQLYEEEERLVERAIDDRRAEFAAGRVLARRAMERLGRLPCPVLRHEDRSPSWPDELLGTITHTRGYCAVAVAPSAELAGIGIDAEPLVPLKPKLIERICTESELAWLDDQPSEKRGVLGKLFFSAKEAFYKCQYPSTRSYLGFRDVSLRIDMRARAFVIEEIDKDGLHWASMRGVCGRFAMDEALILTAVRLG